MSGMHQPIGNDTSSAKPATEPVLHVIDFEDVALTREGFKMLHLGAQAVLHQYLPSVDTDHLTPEEIMRLFLDHVFWEEESGGLIMCTDVAQTSVCLPIPKAHWTVKTNGRTIQ